MSKVLTPQEIDDLIAKLQKHPYFAMVGDVELGPLAGPPQIAPDVATQDVTLYETGEDVQAQYLTRNNITLTLETRNLDAANTLISSVKLGDNVFAAAKKKTVTLVPLTADSTAKVFTFPNAYVQPGLNATPGENSTPTTMTVAFTCKPDASTGLPYTFAAESSQSVTESN